MTSERVLIGMGHGLVLRLRVLAGLVLGLMLCNNLGRGQSLAYIETAFPNAIMVIDTTTNTVVAEVLDETAGHDRGGVAISPDGSLVYVTNQTSGSITVMDTASRTLLAGPGFPIQVAGDPIDIVITPDGTRNT